MAKAKKNENCNRRGSDKNNQSHEEEHRCTNKKKNNPLRCDQSNTKSSNNNQTANMNTNCINNHTKNNKMVDKKAPSLETLIAMPNKKGSKKGCY